MPRTSSAFTSTAFMSASASSTMSRSVGFAAGRAADFAGAFPARVAAFFGAAFGAACAAVFAAALAGRATFARAAVAGADFALRLVVDVCARFAVMLTSVAWGNNNRSGG